MLEAVLHTTRLAALTATGWFGHLRYATPIVHTDDHRDLAVQALRHLVKRKVIEGGSPLEEGTGLLAEACGMLDLAESDRARAPGTLTWEFSHMYDPVAGRGPDDKRSVNALEEFEDWWRRSLMHYGLGSRDKAFRFLGYCCHLLQDMAVPAHSHCVSHGLSNRTADNLELLSRSRRFRLREPAGPPYGGEADMHLELFEATGAESRGIDAGTGQANEIAGMLAKYYGRPRWVGGSWRGSYRGEPYWPYHRFLPSSPRIELPDLVDLRNFLMCRAAERTAQLLAHYADLTGAGASS